MATQQHAELVKLGDTNLTLADPAEDIRGRKVIDRNGDDVGSIDGLMIDNDDAKVRFLQVGEGGFLGIGEDKVLIPVDAITNIDQNNVYIDQTREHIAGAPRYNPSMVSQNDYWANAYGYYGYAPFWAAGYAYPAFPYYGPI